MRTINEQEFRRLCEQVREQEAPAILERVSEAAERTEILMQALLRRLCTYLEIDLEAQEAALEDQGAFALLQTLEEHMEPEFFYSVIIDHCLLSGISSAR